MQVEERPVKNPSLEADGVEVGKGEVREPADSGLEFAEAQGRDAPFFPSFVGEVVRLGLIEDNDVSIDL